MATIREIKPGEDEATVLAEMDNQSHVTTDEDYDVSDDEYDDEDDDDDLEDEFYVPFKPPVTVGSNVTLSSGHVGGGGSSGGGGGLRIPFCHDDDESVDSECGHCSKSFSFLNGAMLTKAFRFSNS